MLRWGSYIVVLLLTGCVGNTATSKKGPTAFFYAPEVATISGVIEKQEVYGPPGYGENRDIDRKDSIYVLKTEQGINIFPDSTVKYAANDVVEREYGIQHFQLSGLPGGNGEKYLEHPVRITGSFYHSISREHRTKVLIEVKEITNADDDHR